MLAVVGRRGLGAQTAASPSHCWFSTHQLLVKVLSSVLPETTLLADLKQTIEWAERLNTIKKRSATSVAGASVRNWIINGQHKWIEVVGGMAPDRPGVQCDFYSDAAEILWRENKRYKSCHCPRCKESLNFSNEWISHNLSAAPLRMNSRTIQPCLINLMKWIIFQQRGCSRGIC